MTPAGADAPSAADLSRAVDVLRAESLASIVDLVAWPERDGSGRVEAVVVANHAGSSRLRVGAPHEVLDGRDPVADTDPLRFATYTEVVADPSPPNERNAYPLPAERLSSLFSDARAPDLAVVHSPRHHFPDRGGHLGEHGSLDVVQSRAPLLLSGYGVDRRGIVAAHARTVDVGPTLAACTGVPAEALVGLDGRVLSEYVDAGARHVVGILWDGAPSADLLHHAGDRPAAQRRAAAGARAGPAGRGGRRVPQHHAVQPHLAADRPRPGPARGDRQRVLRPGGRGGRRPE